MNLKALLLEKKSQILKKWFDLILETYPADTASFLKSQKNQFANPVGHTIFQGVEGLFGEIINEMNPERVTHYLDNIIRVRAIQDFAPSQAIGFIFVLKKVIRGELSNDIREHQIFEELLTLESKIDYFANISFDIYMRCREKIYELRTNEVRSWTSRLLQKVNQASEVQGKDFCIPRGRKTP